MIGGKQVLKDAFTAACFCGWLWAAWQFGYWQGARYICELCVKAGHATKAEESSGTHYYFKAVKQ